VRVVVVVVVRLLMVLPVVVLLNLVVVARPSVVLKVETVRCAVGRGHVGSVSAQVCRYAIT
jgi:hypothetical protein